MQGDSISQKIIYEKSFQKYQQSVKKSSKQVMDGSRILKHVLLKNFPSIAWKYLTLKEFWKNHFHIVGCFKTIETALNGVTK